MTAAVSMPVDCTSTDETGGCLWSISSSLFATQYGPTEQKKNIELCHCSFRFIAVPLARSALAGHSLLSSWWCHLLLSHRTPAPEILSYNRANSRERFMRQITFRFEIFRGREIWISCVVLSFPLIISAQRAKEAAL